MNYSNIISLITPITLLMAVLLGTFFLQNYRRDKLRQEEATRLLREETAAKERELARQNEIREEQIRREREYASYQQQQLTEKLMGQFKNGIEQELTGLNS